MWCGIAGIVISVFAVIILYLTRSNIIDLLDRDIIMYDKNYELKKDALENAFNCLDAVSQNGIEIKSNPQYAQRAKEAYNGLLCTLISPKLYQEFYRLAVDKTTTGYTIQDIEKFKIHCRKELVAKHKKKNEGFKGSTSGELADNNVISTPTQPMSAPSRPTQSMPQQRPSQLRPTQPMPRQQVRPQGTDKPQQDND